MFKHVENRRPDNFRLEEYFPDKLDLILKKFSKQGYLPVLSSVEDAIKVMNIFYEREQENVSRFSDGVYPTPAVFYHVIPQIIYLNRNKYVFLIKVPIGELSHITYQNKDRFESLAAVLKTKDDIEKVPPPVLTRTLDPMTGKFNWDTFDGKTRINRLRELGANYIYAYYVDNYDYQKYLLTDELPGELRNKIRKPR